MKINFKDKISQITSLMPLSAYTMADIPMPASTWSVFEPVNLNTLIEIMSTLKLTMCPRDVIPSRFLRQIIETFGPDLLSIINKCLYTGTVPGNFKLAMVRPHLKKPCLDPTLPANFPFFEKCPTFLRKWF